MHELIRIQNCLKDEIFTFYRKQQGERGTLTTKIELLRRINILDDLWKRFSDNHETIISSPYRSPVIQKYMAQNGYQIVEKLYSEARGEICEEFNSLEMKGELSPPTSGQNFTSFEEEIDNRKVVKKLIETQLQRLCSQRTLFHESAEGIKRILDTTTSCLYTLQNLGVNIENWDMLVVFMIKEKLPAQSLMLWEASQEQSIGLPTILDFKEFLESRYYALESTIKK